jgi:hypothetical protein
MALSPQRTEQVPLPMPADAQQMVMTLPLPARTVVVNKAPLPTEFSHNDDYTSLVGQLQYNAHRDTWRFRYAEDNMSDAFGGSVTLIDVGDMLKGFRSGQMVTIEGDMTDIDPKTGRPAYKVRRIGPANQ